MLICSFGEGLCFKDVLTKSQQYVYHRDEHTTYDLGRGRECDDFAYRQTVHKEERVAIPGYKGANGNAAMTS